MPGVKRQGQKATGNETVFSAFLSMAADFSCRVLTEDHTPEHSPSLADPASSWHLPFTLTALPHQVPVYLQLMLVTP